MEQIERSDQCWIGLQELPGEPLGSVDDAQDIEAAPHGPGRAAHEGRDIDGQEEQHRQRFVELDRMAGDPVAQIDAPRQAGGQPIGLVAETLEQTPQPADDDAESEGAGEDAAGRALDATGQLVDLDGDHGPGQSADDAVRQGRRGLHQAVQRSGQPGSACAADNEADGVAGAGHACRPLRQIAQEPAVEGKPQPDPCQPGQQVEQQVDSWQGRDGHMHRCTRRGDARNGRIDG